MKVSSIANTIQSSLSRQLFDKAKNYTNVIDLTLGDPDYPTPADVCEAGCRAIREGKTKYTANAGLMELRTIVARKVKEDTCKSRSIWSQAFRRYEATDCVGKINTFFLNSHHLG